ncbi:hypothetical protein [Photobacterium iliopiscarium]|uniref:Uncharacterized protein n=1 Tax=Photobacterium iliopiscarium TaxID=56192 RepID=A0A2T3MN10_9GAMM|nr:hypothetical protein [Photobacterium iliopiscarium]PSV97855.1 hypothetical protein C9I88_07235 [Photobacterium iliopiscarium]
MKKMVDDNLVKIGIALVSFALGAFLTRFTMTKKERLDINAKKQETSNQLETEVISTYNKYIEVLAKFDGSIQVTIDDFIKIESAGSAYFQSLNSLSNSILSNNTEKNSIKNSHFQKVEGGYLKSIPQHYQTLQNIAKKCDIPYKGKFDANNYQSMAKVLEKYA